MNISFGVLGHFALHGCWDALEDRPPAQARSGSHTWNTPFDEDSWRISHNMLHHGYTGVVGRDPDIEFFILRVTSKVPWKLRHLVQVPVFLLGAPFIGTGNAVFLAWVSSLRANKGLGVKSLLDFARRFLRQAVPYTAYNYVLFPALAGPGFLKVLAGNIAASTIRNVMVAITVATNHLSEGTTFYEEDEIEEGKAAWYARQMASTQNFEVPRWLSTYMGGLDRQIEHHLFPRIPPGRLYDMAPRVKAICERHGVPYRTRSYPALVKGVLRNLTRHMWPGSEEDRTTDQRA